MNARSCCTQCGIEKELSPENFYRDSSTSRGFDYKCKDCKKGNAKSPEGRQKRAEIARRWRAANPERNRENETKWRNENRDKSRESVRRYDQANKDKRKSQRLRDKDKTNARLRDSGWYCSEAQKERKRLWREANPEKIKEYHARANKKPFRALKIKMLCRVYDALRSQGLRKTKRVIDLVGCDTKSLKQYIESLFADGMTWEHVASGEIHIDHIKPCCAFDLSDPDQLKEAFHFTNLQPLWAVDNLRKAPRDRKLSIIGQRRIPSLVKVA